MMGYEINLVDELLKLAIVKEQEPERYQLVLEVIDDLSDLLLKKAEKVMDSFSKLFA